MKLIVLEGATMSDIVRQFNALPEAEDINDPVEFAFTRELNNVVFTLFYR